MARVVINQTRLPDAKVRKIINFVAPRVIKIPQIVIKEAKESSPWVINGGYHPSEEVPAECYLKIAKYTEFPFLMEVSKKEKRKGYLDGFWLYNKEEALVYSLAHELRHCFQHQFPKAKRMGRRKHRYSESDADIYAVKKLYEWRKRKQKFSRSVV